MVCPSLSQCLSIVVLLIYVDINILSFRLTTRQDEEQQAWLSILSPRFPCLVTSLSPFVSFNL